MDRRWRIASVSVIVLAISLGLTACQKPSSSPQPASTIPPVAKANADVVSAEAYIVPLKKADLSFKTSGSVKAILVEEGDTVKEGQELARLDTRALESAVRQAEAEVKSAQAQLAKAQAGARAEEISAAEAAVAIAQAGVKARENGVEVAKGNLASAEAALSDAQAGVKIAESAVATAQGNLASAQASLSSAQASLDKLPAGATERELLIAQKQIEAAKNDLWGLQAQRDAIGGTRKYGGEDEYQAAQGQVAAAESRVEIAQLQYDELKAGARAEDVSMSKAQVEQAKAGVATAQAQVKQAQTQIESAQAKASQAKASVQIAQAQLAQAQSEVESAKAQAQQAQAQLDLLRAGSRAEDIAAAQATVARAEAALAAAQDALDDATLKAPYDGVVGAILLDEGETALPQVTAIRIGDLTQLRVETEDLSEVDVSQVKVGQEANVTVDALEGKKFTGKVVRIAPIAADLRGDKVYTVLLDLDVDPDSGLRWGMRAFVEINVH